jgi:LacI family transcriptional regulator
MQMPEVIKKFRVAAVSSHWASYFHRLIRGAASYIDANMPGVIRDFQLPRDFGEPSDTTKVAEQLRRWNPDGLLCFAEDVFLRKLVQALPEPRPMVSLSVLERLPGVALVLGSLEHQVRVAVDHLRQQGLRGLAFLTLEELATTPARIEIFNRLARPRNPALASLVEVVDLAVVAEPDRPVTPVPPRLAAWLRRLPKPVGIVCMHTGGGGYLIRVCEALGLKVPEEVAVVGEDDTDLALASTPTLTTVVPAGETIGFEGMRVLNRMMLGQPAPKDPVRIQAMGLHVRESTGLRRAEICDVAAAMEYISEHACQGLTVAQLVQETQHVSRSSFQKHFQAAIGQTPHAAIRRRQFEEARRLLATTELSMSLIAEQCGFGSSNEFARAFRAAHGQSPSAYRQQTKPA